MWLAHRVFIPIIEEKSRATFTLFCEYTHYRNLRLNIFDGAEAVPGQFSLEMLLNGDVFKVRMALTECKDTLVISEDAHSLL